VDLRTNLVCDSGCSGESGFGGLDGYCIFPNTGVAQHEDCEQTVDYICFTDANGNCAHYCYTQFVVWDVHYTTATDANDTAGFTEEVNGQSNESCN
jgi:hypothetical protein